MEVRSEDSVNSTETADKGLVGQLFQALAHPQITHLVKGTRHVMEAAILALGIFANCQAPSGADQTPHFPSMVQLAEDDGGTEDDGPEKDEFDEGGSVTYSTISSRV